MITESYSDDLVVVNKRFRSGKRLKNPAQVQQVFHVLGSNLNPTLTQLAKTKRALFVEGKDFGVLSRFARKLGKNEVANRADFAVIPVEGFNSSKIRDFLAGMEATLGSKVLGGVIFDRDYRSADEVKKDLAALNRSCVFSHIHDRKELENFLLVPAVLKLAIARRITERNKRAGTNVSFDGNVCDLLMKLTEPMHHKVEARYLARRRPFEKAKFPHRDDSTIDESLMREFDDEWSDSEKRLRLVPGKEILSGLNNYLQALYGIAVTPSLIVDAFTREQVEREMASLLDGVDQFRRLTAGHAVVGRLDISETSY
jgi:hypothetical protein